MRLILLLSSLLFVHHTFGQQAASQEEQARNIKIGNEAIAKLSDLKTPPFVHSLDDYVRTVPQSFTSNGRFMQYNTYGSGGFLIVWSFPGGNAVTAYRDQQSTERGVPTSAVLIPGGDMKSGSLSPSGKIAAITTDVGVLFYEGETLKANMPGKKLMALLDNAALVRDIQKSNNGSVKNLVLVDFRDGKLSNIKTKGNPNGYTNLNSIPGKIVISGENYAGILDPSDPAGITWVKHEQIPTDNLWRYDASRDKVQDLVTGTSEPIPGPRQIDNSDKTRIQPGYVINYYYDHGIYVYDVLAKKMLNAKGLYPGWTRFDNMYYFKDLNMLLVTETVPAFTWPNATNEDPGASAFTIDVATGEITPYLLTEPRSKFMTMKNAREAASFRYASLPCERKNRDFGEGHTIVSDKQPMCIVLGYDCDINAYAVARREPLNPGSDVKVSRIYPLTEAEARKQGYRDVGKGWQICPVCKGYPVHYETRTASGWSDWEQKSLNIYVYTRKWETTTDKWQIKCERCKGEAWVKQ